MSARDTFRCATAQQSPQEEQPVLRRTLLRARDVCAITGLSRSGLYRLVQDGKFVRPVRLTAQATAWPSDEVARWIDARVAERDASAGKGGAA